MNEINMPLSLFSAIIYLFMWKVLKEQWQVHAEVPSICDRTCLKESDPMTCYYNWTLELQFTMSKACFNCPEVSEDCHRMDCIPADGNRRQVYTVNRKIPGEAIVVCENDVIVVDVHNRLGFQSATIHWHGINQVGTPFMDGVPFITQCPILQFNSFRYVFKALDSGTFWWHSHVGFQRTDGINGPLIVRPDRQNDPNSNIYDFDLTEHIMHVTDWHSTTADILYNQFFLYNGGTAPESFLVNGHGGRPGETGVPFATFTVTQGNRYRFRLISAASFMCAIQVSIDRHNLSVIATDGYPVDPVSVTSVVVTPAERLDFVIRADADTGTYAIRFMGLRACDGISTEALLIYEDSDDTERARRQNDERSDDDPSAVGSEESRGTLDISELDAAIPNDSALAAEADFKFYLPFDFYVNRNPAHYNPVFYPWESFPEEFQHVLPLIDDIAFTFPPSPLLSQSEDLTEDIFCNRMTIHHNCSEVFCQCVHLLKVPLGVVVEIVLIDTGDSRDTDLTHTFHLHGHHFRVVAQKFITEGNTLENIISLDQDGQLERKLDRAVKKDSVSVPHGGYTIIRFTADNPGFWAFHCHVEFHTEAGMFMAFQVGELWDFPPVPVQFPRCGNYAPTVKELLLA